MRFKTIIACVAASAFVAAPAVASASQAASALSVASNVKVASAPKKANRSNAGTMVYSAIAGGLVTLAAYLALHGHEHPASN